MLASSSIFRIYLLLLFKILNIEGSKPLFGGLKAGEKNPENMVLIYSFRERRLCQLFSYILNIVKIQSSLCWWECHLLPEWKSPHFFRSCILHKTFKLQKDLIPARRWLYCISEGKLWETFFLKIHSNQRIVSFFITETSPNIPLGRTFD